MTEMQRDKGKAHARTSRDTCMCGAGQRRRRKKEEEEEKEEEEHSKKKIVDVQLQFNYIFPLE